VTLAASWCDPQPKVVRSEGPNNYFRIAPPESVQGRAMARYAAHTLGVQRVAAFDMWPDEGALVIQNFKEEFARQGGTLVLERKIAPGTPPDFTRFLADARADGAQAIYAVASQPDDHACAAAAQATSAYPGVYFLATDAAVGDSTCLDDAHASGVMGAAGRGTVDHFGLHGRVHIQVGTLSKAWACLGGYVAGSRSLIKHHNAMGSAFKLVKVVYAIDGAQVLAKSDDSGRLDELKDFEIFNGSIVPGSHTVSVHLEYQGSGYGVFSYLKGYHFKVRSSHTFTAAEGKLTELTVNAYEKGNLTTALQDRPALDFKVNVMSDRPTPNK